MTIEDQVRDALRAADDFSPSPDLFAKVQRSIEEDRSRRSRLLRIGIGAVAWGLLLVAWFLATVDRGAGGSEVPWWSIEIAADFVMVSFVVVMGPAIRRFGEGYAGAVFTAHPPTGERFVRLLDIAYYLTLTAYVVMLVQVKPVEGSTGELLNAALPKVAGLLLLAGVLHAVTVLVAPLIGLIFSSGWRRAMRARLGAAAGPPDPAAERADRVVRIIIWVGIGLIGAFIAVQLLFLVVGAISAGIGA